MPSFKPKTNKKIKFNKKSSITLDTKHKEFLNEFSKDENCNIPALKLERQILKEKMETEKETLTIEQLLDIDDNINKINEKIKEIKFKKKEYFLDNSKCIFEYFENKKIFLLEILILLLKFLIKIKYLIHFLKLHQIISILKKNKIIIIIILFKNILAILMIHF